MKVPPVLCVADLTPDLINDLRNASATYCSDYAYTCAFDNLFLMPERAETITGFLEGHTSGEVLSESIRLWLLGPWSSARTLGLPRMKAVGAAFEIIRERVAAMPRDLSLEHAAQEMLSRMVDVFACLDDCFGVGPTVASKLLAPLRPALFPMWDNPIADAYGFALNAAGYQHYLNITQAIARKARSYWQSDVPLEQFLKPENRRWTAPLAKVLDEWNWIRITQKRAYIAPESR